MNIQQLIENAKQNVGTSIETEFPDSSFELYQCTACTSVCPVSRQNPLYQALNKQVSRWGTSAVKKCKIVR